jgi:hypothetical protein
LDPLTATSLEQPANATVRASKATTRVKTFFLPILIIRFLLFDHLSLQAASYSLVEYLGFPFSWFYLLLANGFLGSCLT